VFVDEIQRLPNLLNEVHRFIGERGLHFILTGSSARKLKRAEVNLLAGRALLRPCTPFCPPSWVRASRQVCGHCGQELARSRGCTAHGGRDRRMARACFPETLAGGLSLGLNGGYSAKRKATGSPRNWP
jgi:hypothetical protein